MITNINFVPGDTVRVHQKIKEEPSIHSVSSGQAGSAQMRSRIQVFEGVVLAIGGRGDGKSFTVRKIVGDVAIERIWPVLSPNIEKVVVKEKSKKKIRRAKLYYLRNTLK